MELAEMIGVSDKAISRWERDETSPDISALINLADEFGVTIDDLIKGNVQLTNSDDKENDGDAAYAFTDEGYDAYMQTNEEIRSYFLIGWIACTAVILIGYVISKRRC